MGQIEVFNYLKGEALAGRWLWYDARSLAKVLGVRSGEVSGDLMRLTRFGYLETKPAKNLRTWPGFFRIKEKYIK